MHLDHLIKMANQIGGFFQSMPDAEEGMAGVAQHLRNYWDPRMRRQLLLHVTDGRGEGLSDFTLDALRAHHVALRPAVAGDA
jgi:formate dehydrogenase subunit delta